MFNLSSSSDNAPPSKCYLTHGALPNHIDPKQPPSKRKPFSAILSQPFTHTVDLILPEELHQLIWGKIESKISNVRYSRVIMPLSALLEGEFFNAYIKSGNILMLSEGRPGIDSVYSLKDGILRLELPKEMYERAGLVGKPIRGGGRKHVKTRYAIEINLRLPSMLHGKKGFERIVWAFKNVLNHSVTWLFHDFKEKNDPSDAQTVSSPIAKHHPLEKTSLPKETRREAVLVPPFDALPNGISSPDLEDEAIDLLEWLSLVALDSPRIRHGDVIDPYLCRYSVPQEDGKTIQDMVQLTWSGLLPAVWIRELFLEVSRATVNFKRGWFVIMCYAFRTEAVDGQDGFTILQLPLRDSAQSQGEAVEQEGGHGNAKPPEYLLWESSSGST